MKQEHSHIAAPVLILIGPTAIGKTALSLHIAELFHCEIISVDSMQVYRHMDIGTAKVSREEQERVRHHLIDIVNPDEEYDAACFVRDAERAIAEIHGRGKIPLLTGGTGLYLRALLHGLVPGIGSFPEIRVELEQRLAREGSNKLHELLSVIDRSSAIRIHKNDTHRLLRALEIYEGTGKTWSDHILEQHQEQARRFSRLFQIGLTCERQLLYRRIDQRTRIMVENGLEQEVRCLLERGFSPQLKSMQSIGYRHMVQHLSGEFDALEMERILARDTRRYAKRQFTWFTVAKNIEWFDVRNQKNIIKRIELSLR